MLSAFGCAGKRWHAKSPGCTCERDDLGNTKRQSKRFADEYLSSTLADGNPDGRDSDYDPNAAALAADDNGDPNATLAADGDEYPIDHAANGNQHATAASDEYANGNDSTAAGDEYTNGNGDVYAE